MIFLFQVSEKYIKCYLYEHSSEKKLVYKVSNPFKWKFIYHNSIFWILTSRASWVILQKHIVHYFSSIFYFQFQTSRHHNSFLKTICILLSRHPLFASNSIITLVFSPFYLNYLHNHLPKISISLTSSKYIRKKNLQSSSTSIKNHFHFLNFKFISTKISTKKKNKSLR